MKKYLIVAISIFMFCPLICNAALCTKSRYNELEDKVKKVEVEWEFKEEDGNNYYEFNFNNVDSLIMVYFANDYYEPDENGKVTILAKVEYGSSYKFRFYGGYDSACIEEYLDTKEVNVTKYNDYSEKEECKGNEDFELCKKLYDGEIKDDEEFNEKLDNYKRNTLIKKIVIYTGITLLVVLVIIYFSKHKKVARKKVENEK